MCLVHEPKNTHFKYENELISCCFKSFNGLIMASLDFWSAGLKKKERTVGWNFPTFCHIPLSIMSHEKWWDFSLWMKDSTPKGHVSSSDLIEQVGTLWERAPAVQLLLKFSWSAHVISSYRDLCVGWAGLARLCSWAAWLSLQNEEFCHGWYSWAFVVSWLWKNKHSFH